LEILEGDSLDSEIISGGLDAGFIATEVVQTGWADIRHLLFRLSSSLSR
jgi:hypothetical protein